MEDEVHQWQEVLQVLENLTADFSPHVRHLHLKKREGRSSDMAECDRQAVESGSTNQMERKRGGPITCKSVNNHIKRR